MALVTTFATTPLVQWLYPPAYQAKVEAWKLGKIDWDGNPLFPSDGGESPPGKSTATNFSKITVLLRLENLPGIFSFVDLLGGKMVARPKVHRTKEPPSGAISEAGLGLARQSLPTIKRLVEMHGERLVELTQRTSAVMQVSEVNELQDRDPIVNTFRTFGSFHNIAVSAGLSIAPADSFAEVIVNKAAAQSSDLLLIPWPESGAVTESDDATQFNTENRFMSHQHNQFISSVLSSSACSTAVMVDRGFGLGLDRSLTRTASAYSIRKNEAANVVNPISDPSHHIFFPYFGGSDDRVALRFVLQLVGNINVTATIVHVIYSPDASADPGIELPAVAARRDLPRNLSHSQVPTLMSASASTTSLVAPDADSAFFQTLQDSLPNELQSRVVFESVRTSQPLQYTVSKARLEVGLSPKNAGDLVVIGRGLRDCRPYIRTELVRVLDTLGVPSGAGDESRKCLGDVAEAVIVSNVKASVLVLQAGGKILTREQEARHGGSEPALSDKKKA